jgi:hypothetical protein
VVSTEHQRLKKPLGDRRHASKITCPL